jgi:hypothetical protein
MLVATSSPVRLRGGILAAFLACGLLGCGSNALKTHHVSGNVSFDGKPVPSGLIRFTPDGSKGNSGPPGYAVIKDGKYDTSAEGGKGHVSGPMIVLIEGSEAASGENSTDESGAETDIKALFSGYQTTADLPEGDSTKDFEVPAAAGKVKHEGEGRIKGNRGGP